MRRGLRAAAVAAAVMAAQAAGAGSFLTHDLGEGGTPAECTARAVRAISAYLQGHGIAKGDITRREWLVFAFAVPPGSDVQIACPYRAGQVDVALLTGHASDPAVELGPVIDGLVAAWHEAAP